MAYRMKGRLENGQSFNLSLGNAPNFMAALAASGKILSENLKSVAGSIVRFTLATEDESASFKLRNPKAAKKAK